MSKQRDPHMPPPEVVDWLLEQEWSEPMDEVCTTYSGNKYITRSAEYNIARATVAIGADEYATILMPAGALDALKAVATADAKEGVAKHPEDALMRRILDLTESIESGDFNDLPALSAMGVLHTAAATLIEGMRCLAANKEQP